MSIRFVLKRNIMYFGIFFVVVNFIIIYCNIFLEKNIYLTIFYFFRFYDKYMLYDMKKVVWNYARK